MLTSLQTLICFSDLSSIANVPFCRFILIIQSLDLSRRVLFCVTPMRKTVKTQMLIGRIGNKKTRILLYGRFVPLFSDSQFYLITKFIYIYIEK